MNPEDQNTRHAHVIYACSSSSSFDLPMVGQNFIDNPFLHCSVMYCCPQILNVQTRVLSYGVWESQLWIERTIMHTLTQVNYRSPVCVHWVLKSFNCSNNQLTKNSNCNKQWFLVKNCLQIVEVSAFCWKILSGIDKLNYTFFFFF